MTLAEVLPAIDGVRGMDDRRRRPGACGRRPCGATRRPDRGDRLATAAARRSCWRRAAPRAAEVVAIDPHAGNDRGPRQWTGTAAEGESDHAAFLANLERAGVADRVRHVRRFSQDALEAVEGAVDLLYVDGAHRFGPAALDISRWGARVAPGGALLIHDAFSSVGVTLAIGRHLLAGRRFRYVGRSGSLAEYRREDVHAGGAREHGGRQLAALPWFARNLVVKAALAARAPWLARALGHRRSHGRTEPRASRCSTRSARSPRSACSSSTRRSGRRSRSRAAPLRRS